MDAELMCGVCLELFDNPLMLPCSHNFCKKCIAGILRSREQAHNYRLSSTRYVNSLDCPLCQRKIRLDSGIDSLPMNRTLENIISIYKEGSQSASTQFNDLSWKTQNEMVVTLCKMHSNPMCMYCLSCNLAVCQSCSCVSDKTLDVSHRCISIEEYTYQSQAKISEKLTEIKKKCSPLHDRIQLLEDVLTGVDENEKKISKQLEIECGMLIACVRSRQEELNRQLHNDILEIKRPVDEQLRKHRTLYNSVQDCLKKLSLVKGTKDQSLKLKLMQESEKQLNSLLCFDLAWFSCKESPMVDMPTWTLVKTDVEEALKKLDWVKIDVNRDKNSDASVKLSDIGAEGKTTSKPLKWKKSKSASGSPVSLIEMSKTPASESISSTFNPALASFTFTSSAISQSVFTPVQDSTVSSDNICKPKITSDISSDTGNLNLNSTVNPTTAASQDSSTLTTFSTFAMPAESGHSAFSAVTSGNNPVAFDPSATCFSTAAIGRGSLSGNFPIPKSSDFIPKQSANVSFQTKRGHMKKSDDTSKRIDSFKPVQSSHSDITEYDTGLPITCIKTSNTSMVSFSVAAAAEPSGTFLGANSSTNNSNIDSGMASGPVNSVAMETNTASSSLETDNISFSLPQKIKSDTCTSAFTVKAPAIGGADNDNRNVQSSHVIKPSFVSQSENIPNISNLSIVTRRHSTDYVTPIMSSSAGKSSVPYLSEPSKFSKQYVIPKNTNFSINIPVSPNSPLDVGNADGVNSNIVMVSSSSSVVTKPIMSTFTRPFSDASLKSSESGDSSSDMEICNYPSSSKSNIPFNSNISMPGSQNFPSISTRDFTAGQAQPPSPGKSVRRVIRAKKPKK